MKREWYQPHTNDVNDERLVVLPTLLPMYRYIFTIDDLGGFRNVTRWCNERMAVFSQSAARRDEEHTTPVPAGVKPCIPFLGACMKGVHILGS